MGLGRKKKNKAVPVFGSQLDALQAANLYQGDVPSIVAQILALTEEGRGTRNLWAHSGNGAKVEKLAAMFDLAPVILTGKTAFDGELDVSATFYPSAPPAARKEYAKAVKAMESARVARLPKTQRKKALKAATSVPMEDEVFSIHDLVSTYKRYLQALPVPLVPTDCWHDIQGAMDLHSESERVQTLQTLFHTLPDLHQPILARTFRHLASVLAAETAKPEVRASQLAASFGHTFIQVEAPGLESFGSRPQLPTVSGGGLDPSVLQRMNAAKQVTDKVNQFTKFLIEHASQLWPDPQTGSPTEAHSDSVVFWSAGTRSADALQVPGPRDRTISMRTAGPRNAALGASLVSDATLHLSAGTQDPNDNVEYLQGLVTEYAATVSTQQAVLDELQAEYDKLAAAKTADRKSNGQTQSSFHRAETRLTVAAAAEDWAAERARLQGENARLAAVLRETDTQYFAAMADLESQAATALARAADAEARLTAIADEHARLQVETGAAKATAAEAQQTAAAASSAASDIEAAAHGAAQAAVEFQTAQVEQLVRARVKEAVEAAVVPLLAGGRPVDPQPVANSSAAAQTDPQPAPTPAEPTQAQLTELLDEISYLESSNATKNRTIAALQAKLEDALEDQASATETATQARTRASQLEAANARYLSANTRLEEELARVQQELAAARKHQAEDRLAGRPTPPPGTRVSRSAIPSPTPAQPPGLDFSQPQILLSETSLSRPASRTQTPNSGSWSMLATSTPGNRRSGKLPLPDLSPVMRPSSSLKRAPSGSMSSIRHVLPGTRPPSSTAASASSRLAALEAKISATKARYSEYQTVIRSSPSQQ